MKFQIEIAQSPTGAEVVCRGVLTEEADFTGVKDKITQAIAGIPQPRVGFDLGGITRTNSVGIREWLLCLEQMPASVPLVYHMLSPLMVEQANMIPNTLGRGTAVVEAFQAPYQCPSCGEGLTRVIKPSDVSRVGGKLQIPTVPCPKCSKTMELDWLEEEYFRFLKK